MQMKNITKNLVYKLLFTVIISYSNFACASTIMAKITGRNIQWSNVATTSEGGVRGVNWHSAEKFHMLPVKEFVPGFINNGMNTITFKNVSSDSTIITDFELESVYFKSVYSGDINVESNSLGTPCPVNDINGLEITVGGTDGICASQSKMVFETSLEPFKLYNASFKLPGLVDKFKELDVPTGKYVAQFNYDIGYGSKLKNGVITYTTYPAEPVTIIIDYTKSFMSSLNVFGDGEFNLSYDQDAHTVSGKTSYLVSINGSLEPGIKMTFRSVGDVDDFELTNRKTGTVIPYSIYCRKCRDSLVVDKGVLTSDDTYSYIDFVGSMLNFKLDFKFDEMMLNDVSLPEPGEIEPGGYYDNVVVMFELNL